MNACLFVGTSFSVGVTDLFLHGGLTARRPLFAIDPGAGASPHRRVTLLREPSEALLPCRLREAWRGPGRVGAGSREVVSLCYSRPMTAPRVANPFVPGRGRIPPYLAGRKVEQGKLLDLLAYLQAGEGAPRDAVLSGPRGNGKTALLRWFQREIEASGEDIDVVWLTPGDAPDLDSLATRLVPPSRFASFRPDTLSFSVGIGRLGWELGGRGGSLSLLLATRCARRPLVLLLDEAHTLGEDVGRTLLNASQTVSAEAPFLLVMAGTPGLQAHLNTMSATFWSRAEKLGIDRLDEAAAALALVRPLAEQRPATVFDDGALVRVVEESQRYPYFLQLWGAALWTAVRAWGTNRIDEPVVALAAPEFGRQRSRLLRRPARGAGTRRTPGPGGRGSGGVRGTSDAAKPRAQCGDCRSLAGGRHHCAGAAIPGPPRGGGLRLEATGCGRSLAAGHSEPDGPCRRACPAPLETGKVTGRHSCTMSGDSQATRGNLGYPGRWPARRRSALTLSRSSLSDVTVSEGTSSPSPSVMRT